MEKLFTNGILDYSYNNVTDKLTFTITVEDNYDKIALEYSTAISAPANLFMDRDFNNEVLSFTIDHRDLEDVLPENNIYFRITGITNGVYEELMSSYMVMPEYNGNYPIAKPYTILPAIGESTSEVRQYTISFKVGAERIVIDEFNISAIEVYNNSASHRMYFAPHGLCSYENALPIQRKSYYAKEISPDYAEVMETVSFLGDCNSGVDVRVIIHGSVK